MIDRTNRTRTAPVRRARRGRRRGERARTAARLRVGALVAMALPPSGGVFAQEPVSITGRVVDVVTGDPIPGVEVVVAARGLALQPGLQLNTDAQGEFSVPTIAAGMYRLELSHPLYNPSVGDFNVVRSGGFVATMQPVGFQEGGELVTGIVGVLTDAESGDLISGAVVRTAQGQRGTLTDPRGEFIIEELMAGQHVVEFAMMGYAPRADTIRVTNGRVTHVKVSMAADPHFLDPIQVTVERREVKLQQVGFYHRRATGFGKFIDREEIERRGPYEFTDIFMGMPGVEIYPDPFNGIQKYVVLRTGRVPLPTSTGYNRCFPRVYVDGLVTAHGGDEPANLDTFLNTNAIAGVEVYASTAGLPPQYQGRGSSCGVILVWTRVTGRAQASSTR